jgi:hypothetical protein
MKTRRRGRKQQRNEKPGESPHRGPRQEEFDCVRRSSVDICCGGCSAQTPESTLATCVFFFVYLWLRRCVCGKLEFKKIDEDFLNIIVSEIRSFCCQILPLRFGSPEIGISVGVQFNRAYY